MLLSPLRPLHKDRAKRAPAYAIDKVAEPAPALACTTSVPASYKVSQKINCLLQIIKNLKFS